MHNVQCSHLHLTHTNLAIYTSHITYTNLANTAHLYVNFYDTVVFRFDVRCSSHTHQPRHLNLTYTNLAIYTSHTPYLANAAHRIYKVVFRFDVEDHEEQDSEAIVATGEHDVDAVFAFELDPEVRSQHRCAFATLVCAYLGVASDG